MIHELNLEYILWWVNFHNYINCLFCGYLLRNESAIFRIKNTNNTILILKLDLIRINKNFIKIKNDGSAQSFSNSLNLVSLHNKSHYPLKYQCFY